MSGQHRWAPGAALTVAHAIRLCAAWPATDPDKPNQPRHARGDRAPRGRR